MIKPSTISILIACFSLFAIFICLPGVSFLYVNQPDSLTVIMGTFGLFFCPIIFPVWLISSIIGVIFGLKGLRANFPKNKMLLFAIIVNSLVAISALLIIVVSVIGWNYGF
jgi:hypothetical protein